MDVFLSGTMSGSENMPPSIIAVIVTVVTNESSLWSLHKIPQETKTQSFI